MRLNQQIRAHIISTALSRSECKTQLLKTRQLIAELVEECRVQSIGGAQRERQIAKDCAAINQRLGKYEANVFDKVEPNVSASITIVNRGERRYYRYQDIFPRTQKPRRVTPDGEFCIDKHPELQKRYDELLRQESKLQDEVAALRSDINGTLHCVNTVKQLLELWPEAHDFLPTTEKVAATNVPIVPIADLNKRLGIQEHPLS